MVRYAYMADEDKPVKFIARYQQFEVSLAVPAGFPVDIPDNRAILLGKLGRMIAESVKDEVRFTTE